ncbi:ribonuclease H, partial [Trifolium pratense]
MKGYIRKTGVCDAFHAELWGMYLGLDMAWRERIPQLIVESDSKILIDMIMDNCKFNGAVPTLVRRIQNLLALNWRVKFCHTWRE